MPEVVSVQAARQAMFNVYTIVHGARDALKNLLYMASAVYNPSDASGIWRFVLQ